MPDEHDENLEDAPSTSPETEALQRRVEYLEWLTASLAADMAAIRQNAPSMLRGRIQPDTARSAGAAKEQVPQVPHSIPGPPAENSTASAEPVTAQNRAAAPNRKSSLESELGSRVLSKVAIVLLLIGTAWFLKWAFDNQWIGPSGRIIIGLAAGVAIVVWSERFRRGGMAAFSYALKAVGSGVLYLSLWAAFHLYHLVPSPVAFAAMVAVTAWNAFMAWSQDAELLASYALLGAYLTPVLLSAGGNHEVFLFNYLLIIAASVIALLRLKPWSRLLFGVLPVTTAFFIGWYSQYFSRDHSTLTLMYAILLWVVFAVVPFVSTEEGVIVNVLAPIASATFGALTVYSVLADSGSASQQAWWAVGFAAAYLGLTRLSSRAIASAIHLALGVVFLTVAIPLKATGHGITVGWLAEALALLWVASLPKIDVVAKKLLRWLAYASLALGVVGALAGPSVFSAGTHVFLNRNFLTSTGAIVALLVALKIDSLGKDETATGQQRIFAAFAAIAIEVLLIIAMYREIDRYFTMSNANYAHALELSGFAFSGWLMLQGAASLALGFKLREPLLRWIGLILLAVTILKTFLYDMRDLGTGYRVVSYLGLGVVLMAVSFAYQKDWLGLREAPDELDGEHTEAGL